MGFKLLQKKFYQLLNLFSTLSGSSALDSPGNLSEKALEELQLVERALQSRFTFLIPDELPLSFLVINTPDSPTGLLYQANSPVKWIYLPVQPPHKVMPYFELIASHCFRANSYNIVKRC